MQNTFSYYTTKLYRDFLEYTTHRLQSLGLKYGALPFIIYVGKNKGCTPAQLTNALEIDWGHSQRSITKLVEQGFLIKEKSAQHRTYHLELTTKGEEAFGLSHEVFFAWDEKKMEGLNKKEQQTLLELLGRIVDNQDEKHIFHQQKADCDMKEEERQ